MDKKREKKISKTLSWLLRHGGMKEGIEFRSDAFAKVEDILKYKNLVSMDVTFEDVKFIVKNNDKKRYVMQEDNGVWYIKATQGHSMVFKDISLKSIEKIEDLPSDVIIHGTYKRFLESIMKEGLKKMSRTHIHFSIGKLGDDKILSGMRSDCNVLIYLDVQKCLDNNIKLYISENNVILTEGINGVLSPDYFLKVIDRKKGTSFIS